VKVDSIHSEENGIKVRKGRGIFSLSTAFLFADLGSMTAEPKRFGPGAQSDDTTDPSWK
jgi:hypothetical protein